ncbi:helix-turn-helix domain-containing protein [Nonomuraea sp. NPDC049419]|uniref:helix-turn-helix domain-containing protein n=1 Tax=Nonomuraea sp. NPDC049419 TaxID=3155772 RepID=UPI0034222E81
MVTRTRLSVSGHRKPDQRSRSGRVSKARLIITAVVVEGRSQTEAARTYGVSKGWVSKLIARYRADGGRPRNRVPGVRRRPRPPSTPTSTPTPTPTPTPSS